MTRHRFHGRVVVFARHSCNGAAFWCCDSNMWPNVSKKGNQKTLVGRNLCMWHWAASSSLGEFVAETHGAWITCCRLLVCSRRWLKDNQHGQLHVWRGTPTNQLFRKQWLEIKQRNKFCVVCPIQTRSTALHHETYQNALIHTYIRTYVHTYIHTHMHTYIHTYIHGITHTYIHTCMHTYMRAYIHVYIDR